ncbi:hypothetical protein H5A34_12500 [Pectobacterium brasiliense]|uniref:hypothetical protein n=1 Tax=Pectobacterium brasiliense TaxID=180957 RepID=UPI0019698514|nr:hypothetical protein [Pectobacterium brasiliense]MBN3069922.1 hypothetical protein [Pectobacterium brasiliense]MBN3246970.1 hypothetical protein [Pectobacterium brasiliense]
MEREEIRGIENSMMCLATFSRSIHIFFSLYERLDFLDYNSGDLFPFRSVCNALIGDAAINWCRVFGSDIEETHWKNITDDYTGFRSVLFSEIRVTESQFKLYWKEMTAFRNNVIAHFNSEHFSKGSTPEFDTAIVSAAVAHEYFRKSLPSNVNYTYPNDLISYGKESANAVIEKLNI